MQNQEAAEHIAGWCQIMSRAATAAAATALVFGWLAKSDRENRSRIQRGGFGVTVSAATAVAFAAAFGFGSRFNAHEKSFINRFTAAAVAVGTRLAGAVTVLGMDDGRAQLHRRRAPFPIAATRPA